MKKFFGLLVMAVLFLAHNARAQGYAETAMMFSRTKPWGSARIIGMGGTQVSLGGDISSAYSNPAGLGMYNRSELSFSPGYTNIYTNGDYMSGAETLSSDNKATRSNLNMASLGFAYSRELKSEGFIRGTFAVTMTRTNNFNRDVQYEGRNPNTSLIDYFLEDATGGTPSQFNAGGDLYNSDTELAYDNYLIGERTILDPNNDPTTYFTDVSGMPLQKETIEQRGGQRQWSFSYGANFNDKFYLGAGLGVASIRYNADKHFREDFEDDPLAFYELDESLEIRGSGVNLTLGTIFRPVSFLTLGFSAATPTYYNLTDTWSADMNSSWKNFEYLPGQFLNQENASTDELISEYSLSTPWRLTGGATLFFGKAGLITMDVESINYGSAKYQSNISGISYQTDNDKIKSLYGSVLNFRLGGEVRVNALRFRGGLGALSDPYIEEQNGVSQAIDYVSLGGGYRTDKFFIDFAYVRSTTGSSYLPYTIRASGTPQPVLTIQQAADNIVATIGFTF